ncbi:hypothetical protein [Streptomyces sp. NBC_01538]|uniref:hypothetical protein n=1 Tax=Streptomyces sp. NBC_01538 TaxID=2903897 RepID=UPI00386BBA0A
MILEEIEARVLEDARRRDSEERATVERAVRWRAAVAEAKARAVEDQLVDVLREEAERWREAAALGEYCTALERRLGELDGAIDESDLDSARRWLEWAYGYARAIDPLLRLPGMPSTREPTPEELGPHLKGWSPYKPERRNGW